jgi:hypothetical protein
MIGSGSSPALAVRVYVIKFARNFGQHVALSVGIERDRRSLGKPVAMDTSATSWCHCTYRSRDL